MLEGMPENVHKKRELMQALSDLGYESGVRSQLSQEEIDRIVEKQITYTLYKEQKEISQNPSKTPKEISPELKEKFKRACESLSEISDFVNTMGDSDRKELFNKVLTLGGNATKPEEIDDFLHHYEDIISDEEVEFLQVKKETLGE